MVNSIKSLLEIDQNTFTYNEDEKTKLLVFLSKLF